MRKEGNDKMSVYPKIVVTIMMLMAVCVLVMAGDILVSPIVEAYRIEKAPTYELTPEVIEVSKTTGGAFNRSTVYSLGYAIDGDYQGGKVHENLVELKHVADEDLTLTLTCTSLTDVCDTDSLLNVVITGDLTKLTDN